MAAIPQQMSYAPRGRPPQSERELEKAPQVMAELKERFRSARTLHDLKLACHISLAAAELGPLREQMLKELIPFDHEAQVRVADARRPMNEQELAERDARVAAFAAELREADRADFAGIWRRIHSQVNFGPLRGDALEELRPVYYARARELGEPVAADENE